MSGRYILDGDGEPVLEPDLDRWAKLFEDENRLVKRETVGGREISTVFLGLDHSFGAGSGPPVLWETMVFGEGEIDGEQDRCSGSRADALVMHRKMVAKVEGEK